MTGGIVRLRFPVAVLACVLLFPLWGGVEDVEGVPGFARKYEMRCSRCHPAWPALNSFGRDFKTNGYQLKEEIEGEPELTFISDYLMLENLFPLSARIKGYLVEDIRSEDASSYRPAHEIELFIAGKAHQKISFFAEIEAEDEDDFELIGGHIIAAWNHSKEFNPFAGNANVFFMDPYDTLADGGRRLTREHKNPVNIRVGNNRQRLRDETQQIGVYGKVAEKAFYMLSTSTGRDFNDDKDFAARIAFDITPEIMVGGFGYFGTERLSSGDDDFSRFGFDYQFDYKNFRIYGLLLGSKDDNFDGTDNDADYVAGYTQAYYVIERGGRPFVVPMVRWNYGSADVPSSVSTERSLEENIRSITGDISLYALLNLRLAVEYTHYTENDDKDVVTLMLDFGF